MTFSTRNRTALLVLVVLLAIGMMFLPASAFADDDSSNGTLPDGVPSTTVLPLLGSNITIELTTDASGIVSMVTIDGEPADHTFDVDDDEVELEFLLTTPDGTFEVEVDFEDSEREVEVDTDAPAAPGDYTWSGTTCDGFPISIAYTVNDDGSLTLGPITGDVDEIDATAGEIEVEFADGTEIELEADDDEFEATQECDNGSDDDADDDSDDGDDNDSDDGDDDDSDDDDDDSDDDDSDDGDDDSDDDDDDEQDEG